MISRVLNGRYQLTHELGRGATAVVFRADDLKLNTEVAIKVLAPHLARDRDALLRFERELAAARQITSEAVAQVYELGEDGGTNYVVMEFGPSGTLKDFVLLNGPVPLVQLDRLLEQLADALVACHERGILHRDLKPSNILFDPATGRIKIIDFGIARVADRPQEDSVGSVVGTPEYMAPEQFEDPAPDPRSDLYAAGAVLYEAATGQLAISGRTLPEVVRKHRDGVRVTPRRLNKQLGPGFEAIILRLLMPDPGDRFQTAEELRDAVSGTGSNEPTGSTTRGRSGPSSAREAGVDPDERTRACPHCGARREKGLPYCPTCARSLERFDRFGRWSVLVSAVPRNSSLSRFLGPRLPPDAMRGRASDKSLPVTAVQFASEPLARWLADELRTAGFAASVHRLPLSLLPLAILAGYTLGGLLSSVFIGVASDMESAMKRIVLGGGSLLLAVLVVSVGRSYFKRHFVALAFLPPVRQPTSLASSIARILEFQRHLTSVRLRRIGRDLLVHAFRQQTGGSGVNTAGLIETAYEALAALDLQFAALRRSDEPPPVRAAREDAILRGTQCLLRITALCRRESAAAVRRTAGRLAGQVKTLDERRQKLENESAQLQSILDELQSLAPVPAASATGSPERWGETSTRSLSTIRSA